MSRHIHILGICGTFMGGIALLARRAGYRVTGADQNTYPPMSTLLESEGIELTEGYDPAQLDPAPDLVVIGNALSRGNPCVEAVLNLGLNYVSGPRWLGENLLRNKTVLAVAGTHGKTSTSSMLAWILEAAGRSPGFLIGGVPRNFDVSARDGEALFVVEADEYDTAFFDKRAKFVHYRPRICVLNNLEYDHADIYPNLDAIKTQFHHLVRTIPGAGTIVCNGTDAQLESVLRQGCWSGLERFASEEGFDWRVRMLDPGGTRLAFFRGNEPVAEVAWNLCGEHNAQNACAAVAAAVAAGVEAEAAVAALADYLGVKRRLEALGNFDDVTVYDDFAHHPTAIRMTLAGLRRRVGNARILVGLEPRSNTMRAGVHADRLGPSLIAADHVWLLTGDDIDWDPQEALAPLEGRGRVVTRTGDMLRQMLDEARAGDHVVFMSNGGFDAAPRRFTEGLAG
ncbi:MAG: UDP-N-acetylmuramate:L-alanyl-gamma-D-glutamyl-meso-diaminopimelate ligase [Pseudomonadota bacterium]